MLLLNHDYGTLKVPYNRIFFPPQKLVRLRSAQERELCSAGRRGELPGAHRGPLPGLPARLPATSDVSIPGETGDTGGSGGASG